MAWAKLTLLLTLITLGFLGSISAQIQTEQLIGSSFINHNSTLSGGSLNNLSGLHARHPIFLGAQTVVSTVNFSAPSAVTSSAFISSNVDSNNVTVLGSSILSNITARTLDSNTSALMDVKASSMFDYGNFLTQSISVGGVLVVGDFLVENSTQVLFSTTVSTKDASIGGNLQVKDVASLNDVVTPNITVTNGFDSKNLFTVQLTGVFLNASVAMLSKTNTLMLNATKSATFVDLEVSNDTTVMGLSMLNNTVVGGNIHLNVSSFGDLKVIGNSTVTSWADVSSVVVHGNGWFFGDVKDHGSFTSGSMDVTGNSAFDGLVQSSGPASIALNLNVTGDLTVIPASSSVRVLKNVMVGNSSWASNAVTSDTSTLNNAEFLGGNIAGNLNVSGNLTVLTDLTVANLDVVTGGIVVPHAAKNPSLLPTLTSDNFTATTVLVDQKTTTPTLNMVNASTINLGPQVMVVPDSAGTGFLVVNATSAFQANVTSTNSNITGAFFALEATFASLQVSNFTNADSFRGVEATLSNLTITGYASISRMEVKTALDGNIKILGGLKTPEWISALQGEILQATVWNTTTTGTLNSFNVSYTDNLIVSGTLGYNFLDINKLTVSQLWEVSKGINVNTFNFMSNLVANNSFSTIFAFQSDLVTVPSVTVISDFSFIGELFTLIGDLSLESFGTLMSMDYVTVSQRFLANSLGWPMKIRLSKLGDYLGNPIFSVRNPNFGNPEPSVFQRKTWFELSNTGSFTLGQSGFSHVWNATLRADAIITQNVTIMGDDFNVNGSVEITDNALVNTDLSITESSGVLLAAYSRFAKLMSITRKTATQESEVYFRNPDFQAQKITLKSTPNNPPFIGNPSFQNPFWIDISEGGLTPTSGLRVNHQNRKTEVRGDLTLNGRQALFVTANEGATTNNIFFVVCAAGNTNGDPLGFIQAGCMENTNLGGSAPLFIMKSPVLGGFTSVRSETIILDTSVGNNANIKNLFDDVTDYNNGGTKDFDTDTTIPFAELPQVRFTTTKAIFNTPLILSQANQRQYFNPLLQTFDASLPNSIVMDFTSPYLEVYPLATVNGLNTFTIYLPQLTQTGRVYTIYGREMADPVNPIISGIEIHPVDASDGRFINANGLTGWLLEHNVRRGYSALTPTQYSATCPSHPVSPSIFAVTVIAGEVGTDKGWKVISSSITGFRVRTGPGWITCSSVY